MKIYTKKFNIGLSEVDFKKRLKISALQEYLQEVATDHAEILGIGFDDMSKKSLFWVLVQMCVEIDRLPELNETIVVCTWPHKPKMLDTLRDFVVKDSDGKVLVRASSKWCIVDKNTRKLARIDNEISGILDSDLEFVLGYSDYKVYPSQDGFKKEYNTKIPISMLDLNMHVNNVKYFDLLTDIYTPKEFAKDIKCIKLNFLKEIKFGDCVEILSNKSNEFDLLEIRSEDKVFARASIEFST